MSRNDTEESICDRKSSGTAGGPDEQAASITTTMLIPKFNGERFILIDPHSFCDLIFIVHQPCVRQERAFSSKLRQERGLETLRGYAAFLRARWIWVKRSYQPSRVRGMPAFPPTLFTDSVW